jgi:hypothetical protein
LRGLGGRGGCAGEEEQGGEDEAERSFHGWVPVCD